MSNIQDKIRALLERTVENGATKHEAELAMKKANELMIKHSIDTLDVKRDVSDIVTEKMKAPYNFENIKQLVALVALWNECQVLFDAKTAKYTIYGYKSDVINAKNFYNLIFDSLKSSEKELKADIKNYEYNNSVTIAKKKIYSDFRLGFVNGVLVTISKLYKEKNEKVEEATGGKGLMVIKEDEIQRQIDSENLNIREHKGKMKTSKSAFYEGGLDKGLDVNLNKQLEG